MFRILNKPIRTVLRWQAAATVGLALLAGYLAGRHGAASAALGGVVSIASSVAFAAVASLGKTKTAAGVLLGAMRAEAAKVAVIAILLWLVFAIYNDVVAIAFIGTFVVTVVIFSMAFFVTDPGAAGETYDR